MSGSLWRKIIAAPFLIIAAVMVWQESSSYLLPKPIHHSEEIGPTTIDYHIADTVIMPGECADLSWDMEGIQAVYLSDVGTVGHSKQTFCADTATRHYPIKLTVIAQTGDEHIYNEEIQVHPFKPTQPGMGFLLIGLLIAVAPMPQFKLSRLYRLTPLLIIPVGFVGSYLLLLGADRILTMPALISFVTHATNDILATEPDRCGLGSFVAPFSTHPERVLFQNIPETTAGEGKIIITGASNANESFIWLELPPDLHNKLINLAIGASSNLEQGALISYLQQEKQTLTPTSGKSTVLLLYWNAIFAVNAHHADYQKMFVKYDQLNLDTSSPFQWHLTPTYNPTSNLQLAYERVTTMMFEFLPSALEATFQPEIELLDNIRHCYPRGYIHKNRFVADYNFWTGYYGSLDNYILPNAQTQALETTADYIQKTGTQMILVHLPVSHWFRGMVYQDRYLSYMTTFSEKYNIPTYDLSELLSDDDFRDNVHLTATGRRKLQAKLFEILVQEGVLSKQDINQ